MLDGIIRHKVEVSINDVIEGNVVSRVYTTRHQGGFEAMTVVDSLNFERRIGGVRFVDGRKTSAEGQLLETVHLAQAMTRKNAVAGLPMDGQKSVVTCPDGVPDETVRIRVLREHARLVGALDAGVIFGPDIANPESVLDVIGEVPADRDHVTGLSMGHGGLGIDTNGYTAYGLGVALRCAIQQRGLNLRSAAIQGSGAVGMHVLRELATREIPLMVINNALGTLNAYRDSLNIAALATLLTRHGDHGLAAYAEAHPDRANFDSRSSALFEHPADLFIPAARTKVMALDGQLATAAAENTDVQSTEAWFDRTRPKLIVQGANHPLTEEAEAWLHQRGVVNLPDYVVNCGGLIGCAIEWVYRNELIANPEMHAPTDAIARKFIERVVRERTSNLLASSENPRQRANVVAAESLAANIDRWRAVAGSGQQRVRAYLAEMLG